MGVRKIEEKAVFLDRDGVITRNVFNPAAKEWESPLEPKDFQLLPGVLRSLLQLQEHDFRLFLISNQPSYAKGKTSLENIKAIHERLHSVLRDRSICFTDYFYCYHHPQGIVPQFTGSCACRKPGTLFIEEAKAKYSLDMESSWMVGDRDTDIVCGRRMGLRTILICRTEEIGSGRAGKSAPDFKADDLPEAAEIIIQNSQKDQRLGFGNGEKDVVDRCTQD